MLRVYSVFLNNGNWNGAFTIYKIASSKMEAIRKFKDEIKKYEQNGYFAGPVIEVSGRNLFRKLFNSSSEFENYNIDYIITEKEDNYG